MGCGLAESPWTFASSSIFGRDRPNLPCWSRREGVIWPGLRYHVVIEAYRWEVIVRETIERLILLQIGAAAATRDKVQEVVESLIDQGRLEREEGRTVVNDVMSRARERSTGARSLFDASMQQGLRGAGVPTREDYEDLVFRVEQLEHRMRVVETGEAGPPPTTGPPEPPPAGHPPTPPLGSVDEPPIPPRNEPDTPPGL